MNVSLHIDADELTHLELADRKHQSQGKRLVRVPGEPQGFTLWVGSASEARDVAYAFLALAGEIELDDLRASMDALPLHCEMAAQSPPVHLYLDGLLRDHPHATAGNPPERSWRVVDDSELGTLGGTP